MTGHNPKSSFLKRFDYIAWSKLLLLSACLIPAGHLIWQLAGYIWFDLPLQLGADPARTIEHVTGEWTLKILLLTLAVTPLRFLSGWNWLIRYRRMLGLTAFFYAVLHLGAYIAFDQVFRFDAIANDITKRPFITFGMASLLLMLPLALTSTRGWIKRLGGKNWVKLHKLVYLCAILGIAHYWWLVKSDITWPVIYAVILAILLGLRLGRTILTKYNHTLRSKVAR